MDNEDIIPRDITALISPRLRNALENLICKNVCEIRLRVNSPVVVVTTHGSNFLTKNSRLTQILSDMCIVATEYEVTDTLNKCCGYSMHTYLNDLINGFITLPGGARVGVCGTGVYEKNELKSVKNITCLNIRIPRNISGVSCGLIKDVFCDGLKNMLIIGPPSSGKTTVIKDIAYQISDGILGKYYKVCLIDERFELSGKGEFLGPNTDVIRGFQKSQGISLAVRSMSPELIICDEVNPGSEIDEIIHGINCGVNFVITAHATQEEFYNRNDLISLCKKGNFSKIAFLCGADSPCKIKRIISCNELFENSGNTADGCVGSIDKFKLCKAN